MQVMQAATGALVFGVLSVCERAGVFAEMQGKEARTAAEISASLSVDERMLTEALRCLACAGFVECVFAAEGSTETEKYELKREMGAVLTDHNSPFCLSGWLTGVPAMMKAIPEISQSLKSGKGVEYTAYGAEMVSAIEKMNGPGIRNLLVKKWLSKIPNFLERAKKGISIADVGCGAGESSITMAVAFPTCVIHGFDPNQESIRRASEKAAALNLKNCFFHAVGAEHMPNASFDFVLSFDVIHDLAFPQKVMRAIYQSMRDVDSVYMMVEPRSKETFAENFNSGAATTLYAMSSLYCLQMSLGPPHSACIGTCIPPSLIFRLAKETGFENVSVLPIESGFNAFYLLKKERTLARL
eukprot:TRINITY_DN15401_c0_g1_i1.p1 TRINITY_DN15401_c0_g1~~TRINITY_DN15401_c0_g1_i1.p1  ORF type:complete len:369 (+),score=91.19 TRINITY_DN15401_c0_g1_i1:42-1109(+)